MFFVICILRRWLPLIWDLLIAADGTLGLPLRTYWWPAWDLLKYTWLVQTSYTITCTLACWYFPEWHDYSPDWSNCWTVEQLRWWNFVFLWLIVEAKISCGCVKTSVMWIMVFCFVCKFLYKFNTTFYQIVWTQLPGVNGCITIALILFVRRTM